MGRRMEFDDDRGVRNGKDKTWVDMENTLLKEEKWCFEFEVRK